MIGILINQMNPPAIWSQIIKHELHFIPNNQTIQININITTPKSLQTIQMIEILIV